MRRGPGTCLVPENAFDEGERRRVRACRVRLFTADNLANRARLKGEGPHRKLPIVRKSEWSSNIIPVSLPVVQRRFA